MATSNKIVSYTTKSVLQKFEQVQSFLDIDQKYHIKNTLNFKYGRWPSDTPLAGLKLRYFGIGIGGRYVVNDEGLMAPYIPVSTEQDLYQPIPFRCRPLDEDLTPEERKYYRMRVVMDIGGGERRICYFLKLIEPIDTEVQIFRIDASTGLTEPYELSSDGLRPTPIKPQTNDVQESESPDIIVGARINLHITADEVTEYIDAKYGDRRYAVISEYSLVSGEDRQVEDIGSQGLVTYTEAISATMSFKTCTAGTLVEGANWSTDRQILVGDGTCIALSTSGTNP